jgi:hypothetical protein
MVPINTCGAYRIHAFMPKGTITYPLLSANNRLQSTSRNQIEEVQGVVSI